jgi:flagellar biosynthesis anti-sigma factor FlgM
MEITNNAEGLRTLLGVSSSTAAEAHPARGSDAAHATAGFTGDQATFSRVSTEVSQAAAQSGVRPEKVSAIQQALASGTYSVPASAVAGKLIDAMGGGAGSESGG